MPSKQSTQDNSLSLPEASTHSFIVKIWLEETVAEAGQVMWRGHITHVASGQRCYLKNLEAILEFMRPYLQQLGVQFTIRWQPKGWLKRLWRDWSRRSDRRSP